MVQGFVLGSGQIKEWLKYLVVGDSSQFPSLFQGNEVSQDG